MSEMRRDPVHGSWVIIASERSQRPSDFQPPRRQSKGGTKCPFCPGNEKETPPEILAFRPQGNGPDTPGWQLRVIPNKFAALALEAGAITNNSSVLFQTRAGTGVHEVIIEGPAHNTFFPDLQADHALLVLQSWRQRHLQLQQDGRWQYIQLFKNYGRAAGASLEHPHSQLIATPIVPPAVNTLIEHATNYWQVKNSCLFCDLMAAELHAGSRIVDSNPEFIAFCPFASRLPLETWILPRRHQASFSDCNDGQLELFAPLLQKLLGQLKLAAGDPPYNLVLYTAPLQQKVPALHWHCEILPRLTTLAGFEWGTGMYINPTPPELAARYLI